MDENYFGHIGNILVTKKVISIKKYFFVDVCGLKISSYLFSSQYREKYCSCDETLTAHLHTPFICFAYCNPFSRAYLILVNQPVIKPR